MLTFQKPNGFVENMKHCLIWVMMSFIEQRTRRSSLFSDCLKIKRNPVSEAQIYLYAIVSPVHIFVDI